MKILTHFLACWAITHLVMSLWLFEAMTGYQMSDPIPVTFVCAVVAYAIYLPFAWMNKARPLARLFGRTGVPLRTIFTAGLIGAGRSLDDILWRWPSPAKDAFTVRDMLRSIEVKGVTGSGKSSGSGNYILNAIVAHPRSTVMIIGQKPEDRENTIKIFKRHGKLDKLIIIEEGGDRLCNFFDDEMKSGVDAGGMTEFITILGQGLQAAQSGRGDDRFWRMLEERVIWNTVEAVRLGGKVTPTNLMEFITTAPSNIEMLTDKSLRIEWEKKAHFKTMHAAEQQKTDSDEDNWKVLTAFWSTEFPLLDDKPRSSALAGVQNTFHTAVTGLAKRITGTNNDVSPRMVDDGYSFLINFPFSVYGPTGRYISAGWKYKLQKHILRRKWKPGGFWNVLACDEYQETYTDFDPRYLGQCRSHGGCMLTLTQSIAAEYGQAGHSARDKVDALHSNYGAHIYHLCDPITAKHASEQLGQWLEPFISTTPGQPRTVGEEIMGGSGGSLSISYSYQPVLQPREFMTGRTGGPMHKNLVDGIVIRGEGFRDGSHWQRCTFKQS